MITEDYVSFEIAKLLKEKGFDGTTNCYYFDDSNKRTLLYSPFKENYNDGITNKEFEVSSNINSIRISAPTLAMAMKWLREKYNINPVPYALSLGWAFDVFDLTNRDITGCKKLYSMDLPSKSEVYNTYEEAAEAAIKYCLENLI